MSLSKYVVVCSLALCLGCGGNASNDRPKLVIVAGRLVTQSGTPVAQAQIEFLPAKGAPSTAVTNADGTFELTYTDGSRGVAVGAHQIRIVVGEMTMGDGGDSPPVAPARQPVLFILPQITVDSDQKNLELKLPEKGQVG